MSIYEENGQIIVDELRPMSDVPDGEWVIYFHKNLQSFEAKSLGIEVITASDIVLDFSDFIGWLPIPIYRPKNDCA